MQPTTTFGPIEIWNTMGTVGHLVLIFLLMMSLYSVGVMIDRWLLMRKAQKQSLDFVAGTKRLLEDAKLDAVVEEAKKYPKSHLARIYSTAILDLFVYRDTGCFTENCVDTVRSATERESVLVTQEFKRGLSGLASIGATAPFVGLFGTVIGIMNSFFGMAAAGAGGIGAVAGGIAEALVNTAAGLFVALPAVWAFNYFLGRMERITSEMSNASSELADYFIKKYRSDAWKSGATGRKPANP
jgi:biopolymer transport protein ExbB/biopolymer transport protein TolQ